jgi:hypothetical protein
LTSYSDNDVEVASRIISGYFEGQRDPEAHSYVGEDQPLFDIESDVQAFRLELQYADRVGLPIPCLPLGVNHNRLAPVSFELAFGIPLSNQYGYPILLDRRLRYRLFEDIIRDYPPLAIFEPPQAYTPVDVDTARNSYTSLATEFLATRIASQRRSDGPGSTHHLGGGATLQLSRTGAGPPVRTPGCTFVVSTNSPGLRVHWSGAFRIVPNYFSSPTSPVTSVLQSGTYIFGVDGGAYSAIQWDTTAIVSLPGSPLLHLNF